MPNLAICLTLLKFTLFWSRGSPTISQAGGRANRIDNKTLNFIILLIEANPLIKLREIKLIVRDLWPEKPHFNENTLSRALDGELYTLKMARDVPLERNTPRVKDVWKMCYAATIWFQQCM